LAIQSLPANFTLPQDISLTDAFKTVGNGVPFVLANGIAESINDYINHINN
jgi:DNA (cytosine-5)-methyltransferase 1